MNENALLPGFALLRYQRNAIVRNALELGNGESLSADEVEVLKKKVEVKRGPNED